MKTLMVSVILCFGMAGTSEGAVKCYSCFDVSVDTTKESPADQTTLSSFYTTYSTLAQGSLNQNSECRDTEDELPESLTTGGCSTCFKFIAEKTDGTRYITGRACSSTIPNCDSYPKDGTVAEVGNFKTTLLCCTGDKCNGATRGHLSPLLLSVLALLAVAAIWRM